MIIMKTFFYESTNEITPLTMAVMPNRDNYGNAGSHVLEDQTKFYVRHKPSKMIDLACKFFGSSLKGRQTGTKEISSMTSKLPISIDPSSGMYFFPTLSPTNPNCSWIAHTHIKDIREIANQRTEIIFSNDQAVVVDVSYGSIMNQVNRTAQYRYILDHRIKSLEEQKSSKKKVK